MKWLGLGTRLSISAEIMIGLSLCHLLLDINLETALMQDKHKTKQLRIFSRTHNDLKPGGYH